MIRHSRLALGGVAIGALMALVAAARATPEARFTSEHLSTACSDALNLSVDIVHFSVCSLPERRLVYGDLSPTERKDLWREHLSAFATSASHLTAAQRARVAQVLSRIDEYMGEAGVEALERDGVTRKHLANEFGEDLARAIFATLGTEVRYLGHTAGETRVLLDSRGGVPIGISYGLPGAPPLSELPSLPPYCTCSESSDWCCEGECGGAVECITQSGCGTMWQYECDGLCGSWA